MKKIFIMFICVFFSTQYAEAQYSPDSHEEGAASVCNNRLIATTGSSLPIPIDMSQLVVNMYEKTILGVYHIIINVSGRIPNSQTPQPPGRFILTRFQCEVSFFQNYKILSFWLT